MTGPISQPRQSCELPFCLGNPRATNAAHLFLRKLSWWRSTKYQSEAVLRGIMPNSHRITAGNNDQRCSSAFLTLFVTTSEAMESVVDSSRKTGFVEGRNGQFGVGLN